MQLTESQTDTRKHPISHSTFMGGVMQKGP